MEAFQKSITFWEKQHPSLEWRDASLFTSDVSLESHTTYWQMNLKKCSTQQGYENPVIKNFSEMLKVADFWGKAQYRKLKLKSILLTFR